MDIAARQQGRPGTSSARNAENRSTLDNRDRQTKTSKPRTVNKPLRSVAKNNGNATRTKPNKNVNKPPKPPRSVNESSVNG